MLKAILYLTAITLIPALELRASIPWGMFVMQETVAWPVVFVICLTANIILGWIIFWVLGPIFTFVRKWAWFDRTIWPMLERLRQAAEG